MPSKQSRRRPLTENTALLLLRAHITGTLLSTGYPIVAYSLPRDAFTGTLHSNGRPIVVSPLSGEVFITSLLSKWSNASQYYETTADPYCIDVDIRKIASAEEDRLETNVRSESSGLDAIDRRGILRGPSVEIVPEFARYHVTFSTAAITASPLAGVRSFRERPALTCAVDVNTCCLTETLRQSSKHILCGRRRAG
jgi:hypothetical protein